MLISHNDILRILQENNIHIFGALHIGAHECEEIPFYRTLGLQLKDIVWIDAIQGKVQQATHRNIPNVYHATITDKDDKIVDFHVSNNAQSSSVLQLGTHLQEHPNIFYMCSVSQVSITIPTFFTRNNLDPSKYNFWNFDIQGAELMALRGADSCIKHVDVMYLEVNEKELYQGCGLITEIDDFLQKHGFKRVLTAITAHGWGDALYIRNKM